MPCIENALPVFEKQSPMLENALPVFEKQSPMLENHLPCFENHFPVFEKHYPLLEKHFPVLENVSGATYAYLSKEKHHSSMPEHFSMVPFLYNSTDYYSFTIPFIILTDYAVFRKLNMVYPMAAAVIYTKEKH